MATIEDFIVLSEEVRQLSNDRYLIACINPAHPDKTPSLSLRRIINKKGEEDVLVKCFGGCLTEELLSIANGKALQNPTISLKILEKLASGRQATNDAVKKSEYRIVKTYDYRKNGELIFQKVRYEPKFFSYRRPAGKQEKEILGLTWVGNMDNTEHLLYHYDMVSNIKNKPATIIIDESEKNVDYLIDKGYLATCSSSVKFWNPEWNDFFAGKDIVVFPHVDKSGFDYVLNLFNHLAENANSFKVVEVPKVRKGFDVVDWYTELEITDDTLWCSVDSTPDIKKYSKIALEDYLSKVTTLSTTVIPEPITEVIEEVKLKKADKIKDISKKEFEDSLCSLCKGTGFKAVMRDGSLFLESVIGDDEIPTPIPCDHRTFHASLLRDSAPQQEIIAATTLENESQIEEEYEEDIDLSDLGF